MTVLTAGRKAGRLIGATSPSAVADTFPVILRLILLLCALLPALPAQASAVPPPVRARIVLPSPLTTADCLGALDALLNEYPEAFADRVRVVPARQPVPGWIAREGGELELRFEADPAAPLSELGPIRATVHDSRGIIGTLALNIYFQLEAERVVSARAIPKGTVLTESDLTLAWVPLRGQTGMLCLDPAEALGLTVDRALITGRPLLRHQLSEPVLVQRGATVRVRVRRGGLTLETSAKALQAGRPGERIRLQNTETKTILTARVTGPNEAEVD